MEIGRFQDTDCAAVISLWKAVFDYSAPHNDPAITIRCKMRVQPELFFVARTGGKLAGTVMAGYDGHRGWIYSLAVDPAFRHAGIGSALMRRAEEALKALGCMKINLQLVDTNAATSAFYSKLGYAVEPRISMGKII